MRAAQTVILMSPDGVAMTIRPGDEFPGWATVTNPEAIAAEPEPERKPATRTARKPREND